MRAPAVVVRREELKTGADVTTTQIAEYPWQGVVLVDTPGVQSQATDVDHDRIARDATVHADLILFVITNELFNDRLAQHLHYVIGKKGLRLAHKTAIVVNKMDRETNPDEVICSEVCRVLGEHRDLPIWFCAAERYLQASKLTGPLQVRFRRESRVDQLMDHIDGFVHDRGLTGRLTTPLQVLEDLLDVAEESLADSEEVKNEAELLRRQKRQERRQHDTIDVKWGRLRLGVVVLALADGVRPDRVHVTLGGKSMAAVHNMAGNRLTISLPPDTTIRTGEALEIVVET